MESLQMSVALLAIVVVIGMHSASALECHVCNSGKDFQGDSCWHIETSNNKHKVDCQSLNEEYKTNHTYTMCRKIYQNVEGDKRIIRDCAINGENRCVERTGTKKIRMTYCECEGSGCNSAGTTYVSILAITASITAAVLGIRS